MPACAAEQVAPQSSFVTRRPGREADISSGQAGPQEGPPAATSFMVERGAMTLVLKGVPARVCSQYGEAYFDETTTRRIEEIADRVHHAGVQVAVQDYAAT